MSDINSTNNNYEQLKSKLNENKVWPLRYMFKFIVPNKDGNVDKVKSLMPLGGKISYKHTESLKFVSVTCVAEMESADAIIFITQKVLEIEGAMAL